MTAEVIHLFSTAAKKERKKRIVGILDEQSQVKEIIQAYHEGSTDKIVALAQAFGIPVCQMALPAHLAGFLFPAAGRTENGWEIVINESLGQEEKRWTVAHEIAHWILDKKCQPPEFDDYRILPRIRFSKGANIESSYDAYSVEEVVVRTNSDGSVRTAWTLGDGFLWDVRDVLESEVAANVLAGYILLPTDYLRCEITSGKSIAQIAIERRLPRRVVETQIRNNRRLTRRATSNIDREALH